MNKKLYLCTSFRWSFHQERGNTTSLLCKNSLSLFAGRNLNSVWQRDCGRAGYTVCGLWSCATLHLFCILNVWASDLGSAANVERSGSSGDLGWGLHLHGTTLDTLRIEILLRDGNCDLRVTIRSQCNQEIRLGAAIPGVLLSWRPF